MMFVHAQLGFFGEALHRQTGFVNHQGAAKAQSQYSGAAGGDGQDCREFKQKFLTIRLARICDCTIRRPPNAAKNNLLLFAVQSRVTRWMPSRNSDADKCYAGINRGS
jgi:hypothetical protein